MAEEVTTNTPSRPSFWRRTRLYLLEYVLYHGFLIVLLSYIAYTFYALFWGLAGEPLNLALVQANIWFMAGGFVFAPAAYLLHSRTRWEEVSHPARHKQGLRQVVMYMQLVVAIIAGLTFLLVGVINVLRVAVGLTDLSTLMTIAIPSLINAVITTIVVLDIFAHDSRRSLKLFRPTFFGVCILANIILLVITIVYGQSVRHDLTTMRDLGTISRAVSDEYIETKKIETDLNDLDLDSDILGRASARNYTIKRETYGRSSGYISSYSTTYQICANFEKKVGGSSSTYSLNVDTAHGAGYQCFSQYASSYR